MSDFAKDTNTIDASWQLYDAERMANESLRKQLELMQKAPQWATYTKVCEQLAASKAWEEAVVCACMKVESCLVANDPKQTLLNLEQYWFDTGMDEQKAAQETALILDLRQQLSDAKAENESLRKANKVCVEYFNETMTDLAASQLREQQLREALDRIGITSLDARQIADDALAPPTDTSALEAMIQKAGEVMRERAGGQASYCTKTDTFVWDARIRALPGVTLEDFK